MGVINIVKDIKLVHPKDIALIEIGKFYYAYGRDAYIISYLFKYKLVMVEQYNIYNVAFPKSSLPKVIAELENKKINYMLIDRRNNYYVQEKSDNKNLNSYDKFFEKAKKYINLQKRINNISNYLLQNINNPDITEKLKKMETIINEGRKI